MSISGPGKDIAVSSASALRALSHPKRLAILSYLQRHEEGTATSCGSAVGLTSSACSYHLRLLARVGMVQESLPRDRRNTVWRASMPGIQVDPHDDQAEREAAPLLKLLLMNAFRDAGTFVDNISEVDVSWRGASGYSHWGMNMTANELSELRGQLDQVIQSAKIRTLMTPDIPRQPVKVIAGGVLEISAAVTPTDKH